MTVSLRTPTLPPVTMACPLNPVQPGRWSLLDHEGHRLAVVQVRCAPGSQEGWVEAWSVLDREGLRRMSGPRILRHEGAHTTPIPRAEATLWVAASVANPPLASEIEAARLDLDTDDEPEGQLWEVRAISADSPTAGTLCGWLLRELVRLPDGREDWVDHWRLLPGHHHPAPGVEWRLLPFGACDLPTFLRDGVSTGPSAYVYARYPLPPARLRLSAFS